MAVLFQFLVMFVSVYFCSGSPPMPPPIPETYAKELRKADKQYSKCNGIDIRELTILQMQTLFASNKLSSFALTTCYLERISHMNHILGAVIEINLDAIRQALEADQERLKHVRNYGQINENYLMLGIPILLKANVGTKDLMETTAGSLAMLGIKPKEDADIVKALRKAGVVILGKTNLSEWASFRGTNIPYGWSEIGGYTRSPYSLNSDPLGSSTGSAVSVAANLAMVSIGTETDGSMITPASVGGICTMKPTLGNPSTKGIIPLAHSQDSVGPMARSVMDLAIVLDVIGPFNKVIHAIPCGKRYAECLLNNQTDLFKVGVPRYPFWDTKILRATKLEEQIPYLEKLLNEMRNSSHFEIHDSLDFPKRLIRHISRSNEITVFLHEFKHDLNEYLRKDVTSEQVPRTINTMSDIINFNDDNLNTEGYNQDMLKWANSTNGTRRNKKYSTAKRENVKAARKALNHLLVKNSLDAVVWPSEPRGEMHREAQLQDAPLIGASLAAIAGYPSINIPVGIGSDGVPFGLTIVGLPNEDYRLLQVAQAVEKLAPKRKVPLFLV